MTKIVELNESTLEDVIKQRRNGAAVAFPTETVYGLGADASNTEAVKKIFEIKGRPQQNPIIVHLGDKQDIDKYGHIISPLEKTIIDTLMPGPLTILLKKTSQVPDMVTAGSDFVGIRIPSNSIAQLLLKAASLPIAAPSANTSGKPSPTTAEMVLEDMESKISTIVQGGACEGGIESTVVKVEGTKVIITRPGLITKEDIEEVIGDQGSVEYHQGISEITPGNMFKHYAPKARVQIVDPEDTTTLESCLQTGNVVCLLTKETKEKLQKILQKYPGVHILDWGSQANIASCAKNLFVLYRKADTYNPDLILVEELSEQGIGYAIMNRVRRSAEQHH